MFNKGSESDYSSSESLSTPASPPSPSAGRGSGMPSIISADLKVVGDLHCAGDIQIEGTVDGDIKSQTVTVGEGANVSGSIYGQTVRVSGNVKGQIEAKSVTLAKTAQVTGDVVHETLSIEAGAHLEGMCRRLQPDSKKPAGDSKVSDLKTSHQGATSTGLASGSGKPGSGDNGAQKPAAG
jgi:cytoskeletal protein CcmA (bactofilin family)